MLHLFLSHITLASTGQTMTASVIPPYWLVCPFITLLCMIATGPLCFPNFWHKHYPKVAFLLAAFVVMYYALCLGNISKPIEAAAEYIQFMALITALYTATNGILIRIHTTASPRNNMILLAIGAIAANVIGTTGASMLFIRPYLRLNKGRVKVYHVVFFIFIVSNIGGALTPIGDPPLFLGFLKGIPFKWTLLHNSLPWLITLVMLLFIFYFLDNSNHDLSTQPTPHEQFATQRKGIVSITGRKNLIWLGVVIVAVFLDPTICTWLPTLSYNGHTLSFIRELILLLTALLAYYTANKNILKANDFNLEPLKEVGFLFVGIFGTMIPALELIGLFAQDTGKTFITPTTLYWGTGFCSSILDNAPTYLNFVAASMASQGADITAIASVKAYAAGGLYPDSIIRLKAISIASVFFGAMTYIGNGPNFMVKSIAEKSGIAMPTFGKYLLRFSVPFLLPILCIIWALFFL